MSAFLGTRLKALRESRDMSQQDLAAALNVTRLSVGNYERGVRTPDADIIVSIADYFDVSTDFLLGRENKEVPRKPYDDADRELLLGNGIQSEIDSLWVKYSEWKKQEPQIDFDAVLATTLYGCISKVIEEHEKFLSMIKKAETIEDADRAVNQFMTTVFKIEGVHLDGYNDENGDVVDALSTYSFIRLVVSAVDTKIKGYSKRALGEAIGSPLQANTTEE
ncbi:helix-turn-helix domain-containing protein [Eubacteriales bacterium OttesenSCG-928-A19]|nr:helix-turn-helix domain-containing protein [Eubacteriales bacterium OttesenSCG-928-A19]